MRILLMAAIPLVLLITGCTHIISDQSLERADRSIGFSELRKNPDAYRGKFIILGGVVTGVKKVRGVVQLEMMEYPLDSGEMPDISARPGGQFLVILPPGIGYASFQPGMMVTMAGEVVGAEVKSLENVEDRYPVLVAKEIHIVIRSPGGYYRGGY